MKKKETNKNILSPKDFAIRMLRYSGIAFSLIAISLLLGAFGYHFFAQLSWIDSIYNASMILTGMGPVNIMESVNAKIFSSCYALFSGIAFLSTVALFFSPIAHRLLHVLHVENTNDDD